MTTQRRVAFTGLSLLLGLGLGLAVSEVLLRMSSRNPWHDLGLQMREPALYEPDPDLGWGLKPGHYLVPAYSAGAQDISVTLLADQTRATGHADPVGMPAVALLGCSFTFGTAIADDETYAWRLQQRFPSVHVLNYGRGGFGTYQSLLLMERILARPDPPRLVLYGFSELHENRNVADPSWLRALDLFSRGGNVATPYCTIDGSGRLLRHPPVQHPQWPLRTSLSTVAFLEQIYADAVGAKRAAQARPVTEQLLLEMDRLAESRGVRFAVVLLHASPAGKTHYVSFLQRNQVEVVDCAIPLSPAMQVRGEGHPNGQANERWAKCIEDKIGEAIGSLG